MTSLALLEQMTASGQEQAARTQIEEWDTSSIRDPFVHLKLADLCEELGLAGRLIAELNYAFRDDPQEYSVLKRLAQAHLDAGRSDRALRCYRSLTEKEPEDPQNWLDAIDLLIELGRREDATQIAHQAQQKCPHKEIQARLRNLQSRAPQDEDENLVGTNSPALLARFVSLFTGREGVYARQWAKNRQNTGYTPIREPLTHRVAQNHLQGNYTIGVYPVRLDGTVLFAALDLDLGRSIVLKHDPGDPQWEKAMQMLHQHALRLQQWASQQGLHTYLEDSGGKGRHLWCFFAHPIHARIARKLAMVWAQAGGQPPLGVGLELYPKQVHVPQDQLGNLIKLPLGIHRGSGRRGEFLDEHGQPHEDQEQFLMTILRNPKESIIELLKTHSEAEPGWVEAAEDDEPSDELTAKPEIFRPPYHPETDLEFQTLLLRCATLRSLYDQARNQNSLTHDQIQVVQHTLGYLRQGVEATNHFLSHCPDAGAHYQLKSTFRGNPMSCARIRARIPGTTSVLPCNCEFDPAPGCYPTPLLHLKTPLPDSQDDAFVEALARDYLHALQAYQEASSKLSRLQTALVLTWQNRKLQELSTPQGKLLMLGDPQQPGCFKLEQTHLALTQPAHPEQAHGDQGRQE